MGDDSKDRTLWCGNLHGDTTEELLYELFVQAGPLEDVKIPTGKNFAFVSFNHVDSVPYAMELMKGVTLIGQQLRMQFRPGSVHTDGGGRGGGNGYQQKTPRGYQQNNQQQQRMGHQHGGMGAGYNNMGGVYNNNTMGGNAGAGMMPSPNMPPTGAAPMGLMGMNFNSPVHPMAGMMPNAGFHRSYSSPEFGNHARGGGPAPLMGRQGSGGNGRYQQQQQQQQQGGYGGGRDSPVHRGGSGAGGRDRDNYSQRQGSQQRSSNRDNRSSSHDRHGNDDDKSRKRRHDGDQDRNDNRSDNRDGAQRERNPQQAQRQASQNFRRQMASPPWKKSVAPWEQK